MRMMRLIRRGSRGRRRAKLALVAAILAVLAWGSGFVWFATALPGPAEPRASATDAIVVLTGGVERLDAGLALLAEGHATKLFVSGVYRGIDVTTLLRHTRRTPGALDCCIVLGYEADNTEGNARETAAWMRENKYRSLRLVTASYHMPRSLVEFRAAMPEIEIVPHAVVPSQFRREDWWRWPGTASLIAFEYSKYLGACARATLFGPGGWTQ